MRRREPAMRDRVFDAENQISDFIFDDDVADVFDDMLERSVPFYSEVQRIVVELATKLAHPEGVIYDIGCSTGSTLLSLIEALGPASQIRLVGVEPSPAMRTAAAKKLSSIPRPERVEIMPSSIEDLAELPDAQVIIMLYTMQFIRPINRPQVMQMMRRSLRPGGCLIIAEKILATDQHISRLFIDLYHSYKRRHGYSNMAISRKREALENVLVPFTEAENLRLMREAGFAPVERVFQWYNFVAYIAMQSGETNGVS